MPAIDTEAVAKLLRDNYGLRASYEQPGYVHIDHHGYTFCAGMANNTWDVDVYQGDLIDDQKVAEWRSPPATLDSQMASWALASWTFTKITELLGPLLPGDAAAVKGTKCVPNA